MTRRLVLNADDFGYDPAVSTGIARSMREGLVSSTTMMVNTPHSEHAATLSKGLSIGLHLNLARWHAVSAPAHEFIEAKAQSLTAQFVETETRAQLDRLRSLTGSNATHVDVHKHLHRVPSVLEGVMAAARARNVPVRSIDDTMRATLRAAGIRTNDVFLGDAGATAYWTLPTFRDVIAQLPNDGLVELMCHPGQIPSQVTSGYSAQREVELATFCDADARRFCDERHVRFESWS